MPDRILITTDDLEHAVRINAGVEAAGFHTTLAHTLDEARQALRRDPPPDCVVVTGGLHESGAAQLLTLARDRSVSTLGLRSEEHTSELQSQSNLVCRLLLEKKKKNGDSDVD